MRTCRHIVIMTMVALAIGAAAAVGATKYSTPAQVLAAYEKAHDAGDDAAAIDCLSPQGVDKAMKFSIAMLMATRQPDPGAPALTPEEKKEQAQTDATLAKYGVKDTATRTGEEGEAYVNRITAHVTDPRGLLLKLMQLGETPGAKSSPCRKGELKELKIAGDSATAKYVVKEPDNSTSSQDVEFNKVDGSWRLANVVMLSSTDSADPAAAAPDATATQPAKP